MLWLVPVPNAWRGTVRAGPALCPCSRTTRSRHTVERGALRPRGTSSTGRAGSSGTALSPSVLGTLALLWKRLPRHGWGKSHNRSWGLSCFDRSSAVSSHPLLSQITACGTARETPWEKVWIWWGQDKDRGKPPQMSPCSWSLQVMASGWRLQSLVYLGCKTWRAGPPSGADPPIFVTQTAGMIPHSQHSGVKSSLTPSGSITPSLPLMATAKCRPEVRPRVWTIWRQVPGWEKINWSSLTL